MPKISILLTDQQHGELISESERLGVTITDLVISKLPVTQEKKVLLSDVCARVNALQPGTFTIPSLYSKEEWSSFTKGSKLNVGKSFNKKVAELDYIEFSHKNSANHAVYIKK